MCLSTTETNQAGIGITIGNLKQHDKNRLIFIIFYQLNSTVIYSWYSLHKDHGKSHERAKNFFMK